MSLISKKIPVYIVTFGFLAGIIGFCANIGMNGEKWAFYPTNKHVYTNGQLTDIGDITDRTGKTLATTKDGQRVYNSNAAIRKSTLHVVGDRKGYISTGAQYALRDKLAGYDAINGFYGDNRNMKLTIDSAISTAAMNALGKHDGCVLAYNYKTGEVLCMVSTPTYDVDDPIDVKKAEDGTYTGAFVNRAISSTYTPGSTFKIVTATAAIDTLPDAYDKVFTCKRGTEIEGETIKCEGKHNDVSLKKAFCVSCNAFFSQLTLTLGKSTMKKYAEVYGFNKSFSIDGIKTATSSYNADDARNIDFGWSGIGQYTNQMNPIQYLTMVGAIANGGAYANPYFVSSITSQSGKTVYSAKTKTTRIISSETANQLADLMRYAVTDNYGSGKFGGLDVCGKTGTAETGKDKDDSVFVGFCRDDDLPIAFVCVVEKGGAGRTAALTAASKTLAAAKKSLSS